MLDFIISLISSLPNIILIVAIILVILSPRRQKAAPPGPPVLPVIGNLNLFSVPDLRIKFDELRSTHGDIFSLHIGRQLAVVVCGYDALYETFVTNGKSTSGRNISFFYDRLTEGGKGIFWSTGERWRRNRTFVIKALKNLERESDSMENKILEELHHFTGHVRSLGGQATDYHDLLYAAMTNISYLVLVSKRYEYADPEFDITVTTVAQQTCTSQTAINLCPALRHVPLDPVGFHTAAKRTTNVRQTLVNEIATRDSTVSGSEVSEGPAVDCLDYFRNRQPKNEREQVSEDELPFIFQDMLVAGGNTSGNALCWGFLYLLNNPDVVTKVRAEIDEHVGSSRAPRLKDREVLHYTNATCREINRLKAITPLSVPHATTDEITIKGFKIPKGTTVIPHLQSAFSDNSLWNDPEAFKPDRFLDADRQFKERKEHIPFFFGPRRCVGESLAENEIFLFISAIVQEFDILPENNNCPPPIKGTLYKTFNSDSYKVRFVPRRQTR